MSDFHQSENHQWDSSHLHPAETYAVALEISQAFGGEAGAALEAGDIDQRREVVVQRGSSCRLYFQHTVTKTSCLCLEQRGEDTLQPLYSGTHIYH